MFNKRIVLTILSISFIFGASAAFAKDAVVGEQTLTQKSVKATAKAGSNIGKKQSATTSTPVAAAAIATPLPAPTLTLKPEEPVKTVGYDKGFFIKTPDGKYKLVIYGYGQFDYNYLKVGDQTTNTFQIRRAEIAFAGNLATPKLTYKIQMDLASFKDNLFLEYWTQYQFRPSFEVRVGQQTVPWIREHITSSSQLEFIERAVASIEFLNIQDVSTQNNGVVDKQTRNGRDIGVTLQGKPFNKKMEYYAGVYNGSGTNTLSPDGRFLYNGRVVYNVMGEPNYEEGDYLYTDTPSFFIGASGNYHERNISFTKVAELGSETGFKYKGFAFQGEFFFRNVNPNDAAISKANDMGYYAQAGYFVLPKRLEFVTRASQVFLQGIQNDKAEFSAGVNGYLMGQHLKLQSGYSYLPTNTKNGIQNNQSFQLRLQTKF